MRYSTIIILFCFIFSACFQEQATTNIEETKEEDSTTLISQDTLPFPQSWLGNWVGDLNIYRENKLVQTVPMELEMSSIDSSGNFVWAIIYGEDKEKGRRPYELQVVDAAKGHYLVDEKNTIQLETYLFQNKLYSWYQVQGNLLLSVYEKIGDQMIFEIVFGSQTPVSTTGGTTHNGEEIPPVDTYPISVVQRAVLTKQ